MIQNLFKTTIGRLRLIGYIEGISLLILIGIAVPLKYFGHYPQLTKILGPVHGGLFLLFIFNTISTAVEYRWKSAVILKLILACFIPFGTFYIDHKILRFVQPENEK